MTQVIIENPILNSPYEEPARHFRFSDEGITDEIVDARPVSSYFMPIPAAKKRGKQLAFDTEWTRDRVEENEFMNRIRGRVALWRQGRHVGITKTTRQLLDHWTRPERKRRSGTRRRLLRCCRGVKPPTSRPERASSALEIFGVR